MPNRILLVEDSASQALRLKLELARLGLEVEVAPTGMQGLAAARSRNYDLVILDIELPGIDGHTLCRRLKQDPETAHIPIIMLTRREEAQDTLAALEGGAVDYIPKDAFARENLVASLRELGLL